MMLQLTYASYRLHSVSRKIFKYSLNNSVKNEPQEHVQGQKQVQRKVQSPVTTTSSGQRSRITTFGSRASGVSILDLSVPPVCQTHIHADHGTYGV